DFFHQRIGAGGEYRVGLKYLAGLPVGPRTPKSRKGKNRFSGKVYEVGVLRLSAVEPPPFEKSSARNETPFSISGRVAECGFVEHFLPDGIQRTNAYGLCLLWRLHPPGNEPPGDRLKHTR